MWGLVARCERAMRAVAPHWRAQKASWGEAACLFESLAFPASWLCALVAIETEDAKSSPEAVIQLLASSVATILKAARVTGTNADFQLPCNFANIPALRQPNNAMLPAAVSLLLPRIAGCSMTQGASSTLLCTAKSVNSATDMAQHCCKDLELCPLVVLGSSHMTTLVDRAAAELLHCPGPTTKRQDAHCAVTAMSFYAVLLSTQIASGVSQGYKGAPAPPGSALLRDLLARPLLQLLHSPLLDTLVPLQHVMTQAFPAFQCCWESTTGASICLMHQNPASMEPHARDSKVAMQVGHTQYSGANPQPVKP